MKKNKLFIYTLSLGIIAGLFSSCSEDTMDNINKFPSRPLDTEAKFMVTEIETSTAFSVVGGDFSFYLSSYMEHEVGIFNQLYNAEIRSGEPILGSTFNNVWNTTYNNVKAAKIAIEKCSEGGLEEGNDVTLGAAKVLLAYNMAILTDLFGDVPYTEAGLKNPDGTPKFMQPKVDKQEDIYKAIMTHLDEAIALFDKTDAALSGPMGNKDLLFNGKADSWKKAAYGLKARYIMRLLNRSANTTADLTEIVELVDKSTSVAFNWYDGSAQLNPLSAFVLSRDYLGVSQSLNNKLKNLKDPRYNVKMFYNYNSSTGRYQQTESLDKVVFAPNGTPSQEQYYYSCGVYSLGTFASTQLISSHELLFLKAEALVRLGKTADAKSILKEAVFEGIDNMVTSVNSAISGATVVGKELTIENSEKESYFTNSISGRYDADPLKEVMLQKYISFWGASGESIEAYNDYRRLKAEGKDFIVLDNPKNKTEFPQRLPYSSDEVQSNNNVEVLFTDDGRYVYTEPVWWAGGTR